MSKAKWSPNCWPERLKPTVGLRVCASDPQGQNTMRIRREYHRNTKSIRELPASHALAPGLSRAWAKVHCAIPRFVGKVPPSRKHQWTCSRGETLPALGPRSEEHTSELQSR